MIAIEREDFVQNFRFTSASQTQQCQINLTLFPHKMIQMFNIGIVASGPEGLSIAVKSLYNFVERAIRLYEQGQGNLVVPPGSGST